jgi:hypothetical protein
MQEQEAQNSTHTIIFPQQAADDEDNPPVHSMYVSSHGSFAPGAQLGRHSTCTCMQQAHLRSLHLLCTTHSTQLRCALSLDEV